MPSFELMSATLPSVSLAAAGLLLVARVEDSRRAAVDLYERAPFDERLKAQCFGVVHTRWFSVQIYIIAASLLAMATVQLAGLL